MILYMVFCRHIRASQEGGLVYEAVGPNAGDTQAKVQIGYRFLITQGDYLFQSGGSDLYNC